MSIHLTSMNVEAVSASSRASSLEAHGLVAVRQLGACMTSWEYGSIRLIARAALAGQALLVDWTQIPLDERDMLDQIAEHVLGN